MNKNKSAVLYIFITIMAILLCLIYSLVAHNGDDIGYANAIKDFSDKFNGFEPAIYVYFCLRKWFIINGRFADTILVGLLNWLPDWLIAIFTALSWWIISFIVLKLISKDNHNFLIKSFCLSFLWLGLPMWDSSILTAVAVNYVWSTAFGLLVAYWVVNKNPERKLLRVLMLIFAFFSGMMHEAMSLPLLIGFLIYYISRKINNGEKILISKENIFSLSQRFKELLIISFGMGTMVVICSPALFRRFFSAVKGVPNDPIGILFLKSDFLLIPLFLGIIYLYFFRKDILLKLLRTKWIIFTMAAFISGAISSVSGIVGRSGWFCQVYSLIAIAIIGVELNFKIIKPAGNLLSCLLLFSVLFCYSEILYWQSIRKKEYDIIMKEYVSSKNGIVFRDYLDDYEIPWYTLGMTNGVADPDDTYLMKTISNYLGDNKPFIILPQILKSWNGEEPLPTNMKGFVSKIDHTNRTIRRPDEEMILKLYYAKQKIYTVTPFKLNDVDLYYYRPLDLDYGDRLIY